MLDTNTLTFAQVGDIQKLTANAEMVSYESNDKNIVTVDEFGVVRAMGEGTATITAVMGSQKQTVNVTVSGNTGIKVTKYIKTVDDFYSIMNATSGYYVLENDLYLDSYKPGDVVYEAGYTNAYQFHPSVSFGGTLDGNGYTIHYSHVSQHSVYLFQTLTKTATVSNLNINVSYYNSSVAYVRAAALAYENKGTIENVYVNALVPTPGQGHGSNVYEKFAKAGLVIINSGLINNAIVNMIYTGDEVDHLHGICVKDSGTIKNTAFIRNNTGISLLNSGSVDGNVKTYNSIQAFIADFDSFVAAGFSGTNYPTVKVVLSDMDYEYFAGEASDLTISGISGTANQVKLGGELVSFTVDGGSVVIPASAMEGKNGKNEFVIISNTGTYTVIVNVLKKIKISTVEDFVAIENDMAGYYVLMNNLSIYSGGGNATNYRFNKPLGFVQSNTNPGTNIPFTGTLDGNGYTLTYNYSWGGPGSNNHDKSLFYIIGETGVVKNLGLKVIEGVGGAMARNAALAWINNGTIENVYTQITVAHNGAATNEAWGSAGLVVSNYGVINNCIVAYTTTLTSGTIPAAVAAVNNASGSITNTAVILTSSVEVSYLHGGEKGANTPIYTTLDAFADDLANFKAAGYTGTLYPIPTIELAGVDYEYFVGEATDLTIDDISGAIVSVKLGDKDVPFADNGGSVTIGSDVMAELTNGAHKFVITTSSRIYTATVNVLKKVRISTAEEFKNIVSGSTEYYILTSDINLGEYNWGSNVDFAGVLDGDGHALTYTFGNSHDRALFNTIGGTVKNLIVNVTLFDGNKVRSAALAQTNSGTIENVYVNVTANQPGQGDNSVSYGKAGVVMTNNGAINNSVVVVHYTGTVAIGAKLLAVAVKNAGTVTNTAIITIVDNASAGTMATGVTGTNVVTYTSIKAFAEDLANFKAAGYTGTLYPIPAIELADVEYEYFAGEATELTFNDISGAIVSVKLGDDDISFVDGDNSITIESDVMADLANGVHQFTITTDIGVYTATVNVLKKVRISTAEEFKNIVSGSTEYYILTSDINLGEYNWGSNVDFAGVLDGDGHALTYTFGNSHDRALFNTIGGTVKNLIVNVTLFDGNKVRSAALAQTNSGTIENVYVNVTANQPGQGDNSVSYGKAGVVMTNNGAINNSVVVVHYTGTVAIGAKLLAVAVKNAGTVTNTAIITIVDNASAGTMATGVTGTNVVTYTSIKAFAEDLANFKAAGYTGTLYPIPAVDLTDIEYAYFAGEATDLTIGNISGAIVSVKLGNEAVPFTANGNGVTIESDIMADLANGAHQFTITTDAGVYSVIVNVLKKIKISTVEDFVAIENDMAGYYVLMNNLSIYSGGGNATNYRFNKPLGFVQSNVNPGTNIPFTGTLDGNGYTLTYNYSWGGPGSNNHDKSLFYIIGETGVVKNLGLNVTEGVGGSMARNAALAWINNGTIENVYTQITVAHNGAATNEAWGSAGLVVSNYGVINNCIVAYTTTLTSGTIPAAVAAVNNASGSITNTAVILTSSVEVSYLHSGNKGANTPIYDSLGAFVAGLTDFKTAGYAGTLMPDTSGIYIIKTVEDFAAIENDMAGYYVLANNLSIYSGGGNATNYRFNKPLGFVQSNTNPGTNIPFTGTLDGNGYTLTYNYSWGGPGSNNHDKSLFYIIGTTGVVKNLGLNVTEGVGGGMARNAALAWINNGTVENVYVKIKYTHNASAQNEAYGCAGLVVSNYGTINNCIVDYTNTLSSGTMPAAVVAMNNAGATINNTAAIVTCGATIGYQNVNNGTKGANTPIYTAHSDFYAAKDSFISGGFVVGDFWTIGESGVTFGR